MRKKEALRAAVPPVLLQWLYFIAAPFVAALFTQSNFRHLRLSALI